MGIVTQSNRGHQYQVIRFGYDSRALPFGRASSKPRLQARLVLGIFDGENDDNPPTLGVPHISDRSSSGFISPSSPPEEHDSSASIGTFSAFFFGGSVGSTWDSFLMPNIFTFDGQSSWIIMFDHSISIKVNSYFWWSHVYFWSYVLHTLSTIQTIHMIFFVADVFSKVQTPFLGNL